MIKRHMIISPTKQYELGNWVKYSDHLKEIAKLEALLQCADCPSCDGSGAFYDGHGEVCQCQWCDERNQLKKEGE